jgi:hypothetical protein
MNKKNKINFIFNACTYFFYFVIFLFFYFFGLGPVQPMEGWAEPSQPGPVTGPSQ